jgi:hypothetical protein
VTGGIDSVFGPRMASATAASLLLIDHQGDYHFWTAEQLAS